MNTNIIKLKNGNFDLSTLTIENTKYSDEDNIINAEYNDKLN